MNLRIFSPSFAPADGGFPLTELSGSGLVWTWEYPTRSVVTICSFLRELLPLDSCIAVRIAGGSFRESAACAAQSPVSPAAANTMTAILIRDFG
jgi:hypothetical protein